MSSALRPFLRASIPGLLLSSVQRVGASIEDGVILIGPRVCWAANLAEFEHVEVTNLTRGCRFGAHVRFGREGEVVVAQSAGRLAQPGDTLKVSAYAWLPDGELGQHHTNLVKVDLANVLIEFRQVPARSVSLDPASFPPPPVIELVGIGP